MALNVGNLAADPSLDSAASIAFANTYHAARGNAAWAGFTDDVKEQLLRKAGDYLIATYNQSWSTATIAFIGIPLLMAQANADLALVAQTSPLVTNLTRGKKRVKIGPIEIEYDGNSSVQTQFVLASRRIAPLLVQISASMVKLVRS